MSRLTQTYVGGGGGDIDRVSLLFEGQRSETVVVDIVATVTAGIVVVVVAAVPVEYFMLAHLLLGLWASASAVGLHPTAQFRYGFRDDIICHPHCYN